MWSYDADYQWYYRSYDVEDIYSFTYEEFQCLWNKASNGVRKSAIISLAGLAFAGTTALVTPHAFTWGGTFYNIATYISVGGVLVEILLVTPSLIACTSRK